MSDTEIITNEDFSFDLRGQLVALFKSEGVAARDDLVQAADRVADYAVEQSEQLVPLVADAGFMLAVTAAAQNVLMRAGLKLTAQADAADARFVGLLEGALAIGTRALAAGLA